MLCSLRARGAVARGVLRASSSIAARSTTDKFERTARPAQRWQSKNDNTSRRLVSTRASRGEEDDDDEEDVGFWDTVESIEAVSEGSEQAVVAPPSEIVYTEAEYEKIKDEIFELYSNHPEQWPLAMLSMKFGFKKERIAAIIKLKKLEAVYETEVLPLFKKPKPKAPKEAAAETEGANEEGAEEEGTLEASTAEEDTVVEPAHWEDPDAEPGRVLVEKCAEEGQEQTQTSSSLDIVPVDPALGEAAYYPPPKPRTVVQPPSGKRSVSAIPVSNVEVLRGKPGDFRTKFVFVEIGKNLHPDDRSVLIREKDGSLREAGEEERDRLERRLFSKNVRDPRRKDLEI
mmetsp:Transcript_28980/g.67125  ORF Transcript_28980/g.67125 Transcript_28980/m.67125 type:complete len:344 (-) Transcript_28980:97-1128(-)